MPLSISKNLTSLNLSVSKYELGQDRNKLNKTINGSIGYYILVKAGDRDIHTVKNFYHLKAKCWKQE